MSEGRRSLNISSSSSDNQQNYEKLSVRSCPKKPRAKGRKNFQNIKVEEIVQSISTPKSDISSRNAPYASSSEQ